MKKVYLILIILLSLSACQKDENEINEQLVQDDELKYYSLFSDGNGISSLESTIEEEKISSEEKSSLKSINNSLIKFGIWYPYRNITGIPPFETLLTEGIEAKKIEDNLLTDVLKDFDVIYIGRTGIINYSIEDIEALKQWINLGGGIIGESEAFIQDSPISPSLGKIAGISSSDPDGSDAIITKSEVTIIDENHFITKNIAKNFVINDWISTEISAKLDESNSNASAVALVKEFGKERGAPIVVSSYGEGRTVYFPSAVGAAPYIFPGLPFLNYPYPFNWSNNPEYEQLFINAIIWASTKDVIEIQIDIKPDDYPNVINLASKGKLPVAIFGSEEFDCSQIDLASVLLEGMSISVNEKNGKYQTHITDINADGMDDILIQFEISGNELTATSDMAAISGKLLDGQSFEGSDEVLIINNKKSK